MQSASRRGTVILLPIILLAAWGLSLRCAYQAGEERLLLRVRHLPAEQRLWQERQRDHVLFDRHAGAARRCLDRLDRLYGEEERLWQRYARLCETTAILQPRS